jgi:predicted RecA/RadA family phage recombinase
VKTFTATGEVLEYTAPVGGVISGNAYLVGAIVVVASGDAVAGTKFRGLTVGTVDLPSSDDVWTALAKLYWDNTAKKVTTTVGANTLIGVATPPIVANVVSFATDADPSDLSIVGLVLTVLDYVQLGSDDAEVYVNVNGIITTLKEGTDWTAVTNNNTTATNLAAAIEAVPGVKASAVTNAVTAVAGTSVELKRPGFGRVRLDGVTR